LKLRVVFFSHSLPSALPTLLLFPLIPACTWQQLIRTVLWHLAVLGGVSVLETKWFLGFRLLHRRADWCLPP
jgi:hypothetical protein